MLGIKALELGVGHFLGSEIEGAAHGDLAQHLVGAPPGLPARGAHGEGAAPEQLERLPIGGREGWLHGRPASLRDGQERDLQSLGKARPGVTVRLRHVRAC